VRFYSRLFKKYVSIFTFFFHPHVSRTLVGSLLNSAWFFGVLVAVFANKQTFQKRRIFLLLFARKNLKRSTHNLYLLLSSNSLLPYRQRAFGTFVIFMLFCYLTKITLFKKTAFFCHMLPKQLISKNFQLFVSKTAYIHNFYFTLLIISQKQITIDFNKHGFLESD